MNPSKNSKSVPRSNKSTLRSNIEGFFLYLIAWTAVLGLIGLIWYVDYRIKVFVNKTAIREVNQEKKP